MDDKTNLKELMKDGYSVCFNEWALDKDISSELGLLQIISSLCASKGYCYAKNSTLAELFGLNEVSISRKLKKLEDKGYITIEYKKVGYMVVERNIRITRTVNKNVNRTVNKNVKWGLNKNVKYNNTSNNTNIIHKDFKQNVVNENLIELYEN